MTVETVCAVAIVTALAIEVFTLVTRRRFCNTQIIQGVVKDVIILTRNYHTEYMIVVATRGAKAEFNFRFTEHEFYNILFDSGADEPDLLIKMDCLMALKNKKARFIQISKKGAV